MPFPHRWLFAVALLAITPIQMMSQWTLLRPMELKLGITTGTIVSAVLEAGHLDLQFPQASILTTPVIPTALRTLISLWDLHRTSPPIPMTQPIMIARILTLILQAHCRLLLCPIQVNLCPPICIVQRDSLGRTPLQPLIGFRRWQVILRATTTVRMLNTTLLSSTMRCIATRIMKPRWQDCVSTRPPAPSRQIPAQLRRPFQLLVDSPSAPR